MTYFNSDGFEGSMCGNGGRCAVAFAKQMNIIPENHCVFMASDGIHQADILEQHNDSYMIALGMNDCLPPVKKPGECYFIHTGSPHLVKFVTDTSEVDVLKEGKSLRHSPELKPDGANVNFVSPLENRIIVRTYERGVENETLSCGTGVTASAICHAFLNRMQGQQNVETETKGGILDVSFTMTDENIQNIILKGPAVKVFEGTVRIL
jgi:diaminopimelate epimerase